MKTAQGAHRFDSRDITEDNRKMRRAVGYIRVSTDMQAADGLLLDAQLAASEQYCQMMGMQLVRICKDVISGAKAERPGLQEALGVLQRSGDVLVVLKFDRPKGNEQPPVLSSAARRRRCSSLRPLSISRSRSC